MLHKHIKVSDDDVVAGQGLVAQALIRKGEVISKLEPNQTTYTLTELFAMRQDEQDRLMHFCYQCDENHIVCEDGDERFMNHSCDPNTWWLDDDTMIARRDIQAGEEVTYDYSTTDIDVPFEMRCRCGSRSCRKVVTHLDYREPSWQARYGDHLPAHVRKAITDFNTSRI